MFFASRVVHEHMVFRPQQRLGLSHSSVDHDPALRLAYAHAVLREAILGYPGHDGVNSLVAGGKMIRDARRRPVVAVTGRVRVGDVVEEPLERVHVNILLRQAESEREDGVGGVPAHARPTGGEFGAFGMLDRRGEGLGRSDGSQHEGEQHGSEVLGCMAGFMKVRWVHMPVLMAALRVFGIVP